MHICRSLTINNWRCWVMVMVGWRGNFVVSKVPNLLLLLLPPTPRSSEARRPQSLLSSWLCLAKSRLDFPGVRKDGNQGFEVSKTKVTGPEERCEQFACSSWDGEPLWNIYVRQEGRGTENSKPGLCFLPNLGTEHIPQGICKDPGKLWQARYSQESSSENAGLVQCLQKPGGCPGGSPSSDWN